MSTPILPPMKRCSKCGEEFPLTSEYFEFRKDTQKYRGVCKDCIRLNVKAWQNANRESLQRKKHQRYLDNIESVREKNRAYRDANPEAIRTGKRLWCERNRDRNLASKRNWRLSNPDKVKLSNQNRRARKRNLPNTLTQEQINAAYEYFHNACAVCEKQLRDLFGYISPHLDHWISLSDKRCDNPGTVARNMLPLCSKCNLSKNDSDPVEWVVKVFGKRKSIVILSRIAAYFDAL